MTIETLDTIDIISIAEDGTMELLITDHLEWIPNEIDVHLKQIQSKIHTYQNFIETGQLNEHAPNGAVHSIQIELRHMYPMPANCLWFLERWRDILAKEGVTFLWRHGPSAHAADTTTAN